MALRHWTGLGMSRIRMCSLSTSMMPTFVRKVQAGSHGEA